MKENSRQRGITLVELLVVAAIVAVLSGVLWLAVAPAAKAKGIETRIRSDLRQIVVAVNLYRAENDDGWALRWESFPPSVPRGIPGWPKYSPYSLGLPDPGKYTMAMHWGSQLRERAYAAQLQHRFDPQKNPIVKASFFRRRNGMERIELRTVPGVPGRMIEQESVLVLGGFLDGHVDWVPIWEDYQDEQAMYPVPTR